MGVRLQARAASRPLAGRLVVSASVRAPQVFDQDRGALGACSGPELIGATGLRPQESLWQALKTRGRCTVPVERTENRTQRTDSSVA